MTNLLTHISLAYKLAALQLMLSEANHFSEKLRLATPHPIQATNLVAANVSPPALGFGGTIQTTNYAFSFGASGKLCFLSQFIVGLPDTTEAIQQRRRELAKKPSLLDTNGAWQLATQWLHALDADMPALSRLPHTVEQEHFLDPLTPSAGRQPVPIFNVYWGEEMDSPLNIRLHGLTKLPLAIRFENCALLRRPALVVSNAADLNAQPNSDSRPLLKRP